MKNSKRFLVVLLALTLAACATQHEVETSQVIGSEEQVESLLVFVVSPSSAERTSIEDTFSRKMSGKGVPTQQTYPYLPTLDMLEDDEAVIAMYKDTGANMGLTIEWLETTNETARNAEAISFGVWLAGLVLEDSAIRSAGAYGGLAAYSEAGKYKLRVNLWDATDGELQWTMNTQSFTNDNIVSDAELLAELVYDELKSEGLLP